MTDEAINGQYRGWGDRVADGLASKSATFTYANLAIRGKLLQQVIDDQLPTAISYVTGPDTLVSFHAGANDALRPGFDSLSVMQKYQSAVRTLAASGATVLLFTVLEKTGNTGRGSEVWEARFSALNKAIREVGAEVGAIVVDANQETFFNDRRFLAFDRLHLNALGHTRCADAVLEFLGYDFDPEWRTPLPPIAPPPRVAKQAETAAWFALFALPWVIRRLRGRSSGDGRQCKYPTPISWPLAQIPTP